MDLLHAVRIADTVRKEIPRLIQPSSHDYALARLLDELERLRAEIDECKRISGARLTHIERLCSRKKFQCAASGCPGCAVCDPVAALAAKGEE